jgi:hypothetical protein
MTAWKPSLLARRLMRTSTTWRPWLLRAARTTRRSSHVSGFVIGRLVPAPPVYEPGGLTCLVDDFAVESVDAWQSLGPVLLRDVSRAAGARGAAQVVVVSGRHDQPKRLALQAAGLVPATEWWIGSIDSA